MGQSKEPEKENFDPVVNWTEEEKKAEQRRIFKNILLISISFLMTFNAFQVLVFHPHVKPTFLIIWNILFKLNGE